MELKRTRKGSAAFHDTLHRPNRRLETTESRRLSGDDSRTASLGEKERWPRAFRAERRRSASLCFDELPVPPASSQITRPTPHDGRAPGSRTSRARRQLIGWKHGAFLRTARASSQVERAVFPKRPRKDTSASFESSRQRTHAKQVSGFFFATLRFQQKLLCKAISVARAPIE